MPIEVSRPPTIATNAAHISRPIPFNPGIPAAASEAGACFKTSPTQFTWQKMHYSIHSRIDCSAVRNYASITMHTRFKYNSESNQIAHLENVTV